MKTCCAKAVTKFAIYVVGDCHLNLQPWFQQIILEPYVLAISWSQKKSCSDFPIIKIGEKEMQMKLPPLRENLLCKSLYCVCYIDS